jgi:hypothetical protein
VVLSLASDVPTELQVVGLVEGNRGVDADRTLTTAAIRRAARKKEGQLGFAGLREEEQDKEG